MTMQRAEVDDRLAGLLAQAAEAVETILPGMGMVLLCWPDKTTPDHALFVVSNADDATLMLACDTAVRQRRKELT